MGDDGDLADVPDAAGMAEFVVEASHSDGANQQLDPLVAGWAMARRTMHYPHLLGSVPSSVPPAWIQAAQELTAQAVLIPETLPIGHRVVVEFRHQTRSGCRIAVSPRFAHEIQGHVSQRSGNRVAVVEVGPGAARLRNEQQPGGVTIHVG
jgi:hypothetical protein